MNLIKNYIIFFIINKKKYFTSFKEMVLGCLPLILFLVCFIAYSIPSNLFKHLYTVPKQPEPIIILIIIKK